MSEDLKEELQEMLDKARKAQAIVEHWPQEKVDEMDLKIKELEKK